MEISPQMRPMTSMAESGKARGQGRELAAAGFTEGVARIDAELKRRGVEVEVAAGAAVERPHTRAPKGGIGVV